MDAGRFEQNKRRLWLWIATPVVVMVLAGFPSWLHLQRARRVLAERQMLLAGADLLTERLGSADALLRGLVAEGAHGAEAADETTRRINQAATRAGFAIRSLSVEKGTSEADGFIAQRIVVQGQGSQSAIIRWLAELQKPALLLRVETVKLTALGLPPEDITGGEFTFVLYLGAS